MPSLWWVGAAVLAGAVALGLLEGAAQMGADGAVVRVVGDGSESGAAYEPLDTVALRGTAPGGGRLELRDGRGVPYASRPVDGAFDLPVKLGGALGRQAAVLVDADGHLLAECPFDVEAKTGVQCDTGGYDEIWNKMADFIAHRGLKRTMTLGGRRMTVYVYWLRDNVHVMKAFKYWEPDIGLFEEHMLDLQTPGGIIYDYVMGGRQLPMVRDRAEVFEPRYSRIEEDERRGYNRLPITADVEYLAVEGIYTAWQARGDDEWMARQLPRLEKAIEYVTTDPLRWSEEHGLIKRAYTIDGWDFKFFGFDRSHLHGPEQVYEAVFNIHADTPMCIMHGDNSGLYQACRQMATMFAALGNAEKQAHYDALAGSVRANADEHCWNGRYYDHWVPVTPLELDQGGVDGSKVLSLSNPYDINRGLPDHEKAVRIIGEYRRIREETRDRYFAEWFSVYPWWPKGFSGIEPGEYINGGIIIIVAGELAKAAFHHGFEEYGADILRRVHGLMQDYRPTGRGRYERGSPLACTYTPTGEVSTGIPDGWAQAAVMSAIMEGLCGIRDESKVFGRASVAPRWTAAGVTEAHVTARYGASDGYLAYAFRHDAEAGRIELTVAGSGECADLHVLLPAGAEAVGVTVDGEPADFDASTVEGSGYVDLALSDPALRAVQVAYRPQ